MAEAELEVSFAGPLVTFQDGGRKGHLRHGVCASGPMDRLAFAAAHAALGNPPGQTAIEVSLGGLILTCTTGAVTLAICGGALVLDHGGQVSESWRCLTIREGQRLAIRAGKAGSWCYLAVAGRFKTGDWLGSSATHSTSGFGGGALASGDKIRIEAADIREDRLGDIARPPAFREGAIGVVIGPQDRHFEDHALHSFLNEPFQVTDDYDRMGMRLSGPKLPLKGALSIPSEPIIRGSVQVSGDGVPTVLLADHQTTGGYPKIATVISCDTDRISQLRSGQTLRFSALSPREALETARKTLGAEHNYLKALGIARGTLEQRLMRENLIHGWRDGGD